LTTIPPEESWIATRAGVPSRPGSAVTTPEIATTEPIGWLRASAIVDPAGVGLGDADGEALGVAVGVGVGVAVAVGVGVGSRLGVGLGVGSRSSSNSPGRVAWIR
jgi:hypothetical protein